MYGASPFGITAYGASPASAEAALVSADYTSDFAVASVVLVSADYAISYSIGALVAANYTSDFAVASAVLVFADYTSAFMVVAIALVSADYTNTFAISNGGSLTFVPSPARTVKVQAVDRAFTAGSFWNMADPKKPKGLKDPNATLDFSFDWTAWLADCSDTLLSADFVLGDGLANAGEHTDGAVSTVFISGGVAGVVPITCRIVTASVPARIEDRTIYLTIEDR